MGNKRLSLNQRSMMAGILTDEPGIAEPKTFEQWWLWTTKLDEPTYKKLLALIYKKKTAELNIALAEIK